MDWQPITTIPQNEPVQLARFPALAGEEPAQWFGCSMVTGEDAKRLDGLNGATHWRKLSVTVSET